MLSSNLAGQPEQDQTIRKLERYHQSHYSLVIIAIFTGLIAFIVWASFFKIDEVARAQGEVIASSRVQVIQSVDGGVLTELHVREGTRVEAGQILAELDRSRIGASVKEIEARLAALRAKADRLRAEVTGRDDLVFSADMTDFPDIAEVELALFEQRQSGLAEELRTLEVAVELALEEAMLVRRLEASGDVSRSETIRAERALNEAQARLVNRKNQFLEDARVELTDVEDKIAQNVQVYNQRKQQLIDSVFYANVPGIVKNIRVTTVGGVLRAGEELMQIIPIDDKLIVESKVKPTDIGLVRDGLEATIRFDPFDFTLFGGVAGEVIYVSADTIKEDSARGEEIYYRAHIAVNSDPVTTTIGRQIDIMPGMTAQVDIRTGERTLLTFLLKPLRRTISESFGER